MTMRHDDDEVMHELSEKTAIQSEVGRLLELWLFAIYYVPAGQ